jgi:replicative DNA helicase
MVGTTEFKGNRRMQIEEITRHMKGYAKDLSIPIILLSQLSRASDKENRKPKLSDLRESGSIEQDADLVIFIYEPDIKSIRDKIPTITDEEAKRVIEIIVGKQRNGPVGNFYLYRHREYTLFENMEY